MSTWPATLPAPLNGGFRELWPNNIIRTQMDKGPPKVRRRTTANVATLQMQFLMSTAQVSTLETFFQGDAAYGAAAFDFTHPRTGSTVSCRFTRPPEFGTTNGAYWPVSVELEVLP